MSVVRFSDTFHIEVEYLLLNLNNSYLKRWIIVLLYLFQKNPKSSGRSGSALHFWSCYLTGARISRAIAFTFIYRKKKNRVTYYFQRDLNCSCRTLRARWLNITKSVDSNYSKKVFNMLLIDFTKVNGGKATVF